MSSRASWTGWCTAAANCSGSTRCCGTSRTLRWPAGFGKGTARVRLAPAADGAGCEMNYEVTAQVGGKIAQVGQRLVDGVARAMAEDFFKRFDEEMARRHPQVYAEQAAQAQPA